MPETVIYRGPSGTIIDAPALEAALANQEMCLVLHRDTAAGRVQLDHFTTRKVTSPDDDPCAAQIVSTGRIRGVVIDEEKFTAGERVEGTARLLRRVLPEPANVIAHMSDEQWAEVIVST